MINVNLIYPIGSVYMSIDSKNPSKIFGGTWERIKGKMLLGVDENDTDFSASSKTGGTKEHRHLEGIFAYNGKLGVSNTNIGTQSSKKEIYTVNGTTGFTNIQGSQLCDVYSTEYSSNIPPYFTVYIWYRTA